MMLLYFIIISSFIIASLGNVNTGLCALSASLNLPYWAVYSYWQCVNNAPLTDPCVSAVWTDILCDDNNQIISIDLSNLGTNVIGTLPSELATLSALTKLAITQSGLAGMGMVLALIVTWLISISPILYMRMYIIIFTFTYRHNSIIFWKFSCSKFTVSGLQLTDRYITTQK